MLNKPETFTAHKFLIKTNQQVIIRVNLSDMKKSQINSSKSKASC